MEVGVAVSGLTALLTALPGVLIAGGALVVARRKASGSIRSSESKELWEESASIRVELRAEVTALRAENVVLREEHEECLARERGLVSRIEALERGT